VNAAVSTGPRPLFQIWPELEQSLGFLALGDFPTPIEPLTGLAPGAGLGGDTYVKRDDLSAAIYGGNKVRTLEALFGQARREGHSTIVATGAYGSNHAVATALHARRAGFCSQVALFPQPYSLAAMENLRVSLTQADEVTDLLHWSVLPPWMWRRSRAAPAFVMPPGGAIPRGCLGFLSAGLELALQVDAGALPPPDEVVIALGSTCSSAGLLVGMRLAARLGIGWGRGRGPASAPRPDPEGSRAPPLLVAVRVTPWPVTSAFRILNLARRLSTWLHALTRRPELELARADLACGLLIDGGELGRGYGLPTARGLEAISLLSPFSSVLDTTYSAKSAAGLLGRMRRAPGVVRVFWSTKSGAPLPDVPEAALAGAPRRMLRWLERGAARREGQSV